MEIKLSAILQLNDGNNTKLYELPSEGRYVGVPGLTEKDLGRTIKIAAGATDTQISLGGVDEAKVLAIISDQTISYKKNSSGGEANSLVATQILGTDKKYGFHILTTSGVTSLYFSNSGSETATVEIYLAS